MLPDPRPGLVIRYSYLWKREHRAGQEEGAKDRPCAIILTTQSAAEGEYVLVVPITHTPPDDEKAALELPPRLKEHLGLDAERSWAVFSEANRFLWPGPDLRPVRTGEGHQSFAYGMLPPRFFNALKTRMIERLKAKRFASVNRTK